jgi:hypothetical protein
VDRIPIGASGATSHLNLATFQFFQRIHAERFPFLQRRVAATPGRSTHSEEFEQEFRWLGGLRLAGRLRWPLRGQRTRNTSRKYKIHEHRASCIYGLYFWCAPVARSRQRRSNSSASRRLGVEKSHAIASSFTNATACATVAHTNPNVGHGGSRRTGPDTLTIIQAAIEIHRHLGPACWVAHQFQCKPFG